MFVISCGRRRNSLHSSCRRLFQKNFSSLNIMAEYLSPVSQENDLIISNDMNGIQLAANAIANGEVIAFPTETVYGLGANALDEKAVLSIFEAKGRPLTDPLIVHVPDIGSALRLISTDTRTESVFRLLGNQFWPGPLTIIAQAAPCIPKVVTANTGFVGIRIPAHPLALTFLREVKLPIAAPSANKFGHVSPTRAQHVLDDLGGKGVRVLTGDTPEYEKYTCQHGIESTILKIDVSSSKIFILRQGAISEPEIISLLHSNSLYSGDHHEDKLDEQLNWSVEAIHRAVSHNSSSTTTQLATQEIQGEVAPGQLLTHYAPYVPCTVINSIEIISPTITSFLSTSNSSERPSTDALTLSLSRYTKETVQVSSKQFLTQTVLIDFNGQFSSLASLCLAYRDLSPSGNTIEAAKELFHLLRWAENQSSATRVFLAPICQHNLPHLLEQQQHEQSATIDSDDSHNAPLSTSLSEPRSINQKYDPSLGLADRIFRAASGVAVNLVIADHDDDGVS